jgi:protein TonB
VLASGSLESCSVLDESPAGFGFGAAAVKMARWFQMRPKTLDGKPVAGGDVVIPINFGIRPF